jgi:hypothetical protein
MAQWDRKRPTYFPRKRAKAEGISATSGERTSRLASEEPRLSAVTLCSRLEGPSRVRWEDLGSHPGSWAGPRFREKNPRPVLVASILQETPQYPDPLVGSVATVDPAEIERLLGGKADLVLSDMAPNTTGARLKDHVDQLELVREAWRIAARSCGRGGTFVAKSSTARTRRRSWTSCDGRSTRSNGSDRKRRERTVASSSRWASDFAPDQGLVIHSTSVRTITPVPPAAR